MGLQEVNRARIEMLEREIAVLKGDVGSISPIVTDKSFPNITPDAPLNVTAEALFRTILVMWDFNSASYVSKYEVYASKENNFTPRAEHLVWSGNTGSYTHKASTGETWYFRVRAVNTHGEASVLSAQVSATTVDISGFEIEEKYKIDLVEEVNQYSDENKREILKALADKLDAQVFYDNLILKSDIEDIIDELRKKLDEESVQSIVSKAVDELVITQDKIAPHSIGTNQLEAGAITEEKMKWAHHLIF